MRVALRLVHRRFPNAAVALCGAATVALLAILALGGRAQAAETIYWDNYSGDPDTVSFANIDGSGGGALNLAGATLDDPEGMAFDSATGRIYVASSAGNQIVWIAVDGSGAGVLNTAGAVVGEPYGVAIDPSRRTIYWANSDGTGSISGANLDGAGGSQLNTAGATVNDPYKIAVDTVAGRVYWANSSDTPNTISYASTANTGGGNLPLSGGNAPKSVYALAVDPAADRLYWIDEGKRLLYASLGGGEGTEVNLAGSKVNSAYGLAVDPTVGKAFWGNYGNGEERLGAIGVADLGGGGGGITPATAPVDGPQDPVILKPPSGEGAPVASRVTVPSSLSCTEGNWGADFAGSFVYRAPRTLAYQWMLGGAPISGATGSTFVATSPGAYTCAVTAANHAGEATQASAPVNVKAAKLKLAVKTKKPRAKAGKAAKVKVRVVNQGDLAASGARLCLKPPKKAKKFLKAGKCKRLGTVKARGKRVVKLRVKLRNSASGEYRVRIVVKGAKGKAAKTKIGTVG